MKISTDLKKVKRSFCLFGIGGSRCVRLGLGAPAATSESSSPASGTVNLGGEVANWPVPVHPWLFFGGG